MSDVEAVSLPAALEVPRDTLAVKSDPPAPSSPGKAPVSSQPSTQHSNPVDQEDEDQGPPSPRADSEAETIIQSGRESLSPEKKRKHIRHDPLRQAVNGVDGAQRKKPRLDGNRRLSGSRSPSPRRAGSPSHAVKIEKVEEPPSVTRAVLDEANVNQGEKPRIYRKRSFSDSVDDKGDRRRSSHPMNDIPNLKRVNALSQNTARSLSPKRSSHQRSSSGSLLNNKKKAPTPLPPSGYQRQHSEDRESTSSSASSSPLPSNHLRRLGSGAGASASPAKHMGPKKLRDKSGRTPLARACADRKHDQVMARHHERPEDLNVPDNAGNTPLQIASLNGEASIVKFLLEAGCEINTKNIDKDTPLIDAVENGHVDVVRLLLDAGANPRTVNASGDEPYELVPPELKDEKEEDYDDIRKALANAKSNQRPGRRSEDRVGSDSKATSSRRASGASMSRSPPPLSGAASRRKTGRSEATRNDLLWTQPTPENLTNFAAKGDEQGVVSILNVLQKADNASLIAAAKGGHGDVLSLMYAIGNADADPSPLRGAGHKAGFNTPMLAAIGRGNTAVIELILSQPGFNPTRRLFEDRTYYELSRARQGENWEEEYDILKSAYEKASHDKGRKGHSSPRRARPKVKDDERRPRRESSSPVARPKKPKESPPSKPNNNLNSASSRPRSNDDHPRPKSSKEKHNNASSDLDTARSDSVKPKSSSARRDSESSGITRPDEIRKRRLIAGRRPQEQDRRPSLFSSDSLSGREEPPKAQDSSLKRIRTETSPERSRSRGPDQDRLSPESRKKKRRVLTEEKSANMPNGRLRNSDDVKDTEKPKSRPLPEDTPAERPTVKSKPADGTKKPALPTQSSNDGIAKKNSDVKTEPRENVSESVAESLTDEKQDEREAEKRRKIDTEKAEAKLAEAKKAEEDRIAEEKRVEEEAERARRSKEEAEQAARVAREKAEDEERKRKEAEQRRAKQAEDERQKRAEQERARVMKLRREQEAQEQRRRDALPGRLRMSANLIGFNDPHAKSLEWLQKFTPLVTVFTRQLEPGCAPDVAEERWVPNYLVAPLLATNDLQLSQYASWEKRKATPTQRNNLWRCTRRHLVPTDDPKYRHASFGQIMQLDCETQPKYFEMEHIFWIRLSDFMDLVPHIPHLHGLKLDDILSMHIDPEPSTSNKPPVQINGRHTPPVVDSFPEPHAPGVPNGHSHSRPGTYF